MHDAEGVAHDATVQIHADQPDQEAEDDEQEKEGVEGSKDHRPEPEGNQRPSDHAGGEAVDRLAAEALEDWLDITEPLLGPLGVILERATTLEEARTMLAAARLDPSPLIEALATNTAIARGLGDTADDLPEG